MKEESKDNKGSEVKNHGRKRNQRVIRLQEQREGKKLEGKNR